MAALEPQHPPGYPLLTLLGRLAALMPVGGFAFRINLLGAVLLALAAVRLGGLAERLSGSRFAGTIAAWIAGLGHTAWAQAVSAKGAVYGLNAVLLIELIRLTTGRSKPVRTAATAGLIAGLGLANHWMSIVVGGLGLATGILVGAMHGHKKSGAVKISDSIHLKPLMFGILFSCIASSSYLFLPIRSASSPPLALNWGRPETFRQFIWHVSRAQYAPIETGARLPGYWPGRLKHLGMVALREWSWVGLPVCLAGAGLLVARSVGAAWAPLGVAAALLGGVLVVSNPPMEKFHITEPYLLPVWLLLAMGGGMAAARWAGGRPGRTALAAVLLVHAIRTGARLDASRYYVSYDYAWNLLLAAPRDAVVFAETDFDLFSLLEHHAVERRRPDVAVAAAVFLDYDWYRETAHRLLPDVIPRAHELGEYTVRPTRPLVYTSQHAGGDGVLKPVGLVMRPPLGTGWGLEDSARVWRALRFRGLWPDDPDRFTLAKDLHISYGVQMLRFAAEARGQDGDLAIVAYRKAARYPAEGPARIMARYAAAQLILQRLPQAAAPKAAGLALAATELDAILAEEPRFWRAWLLKGNVLYMVGNREGAQSALARALAVLPPDSPERMKVMGLLRGL